MDRRSFLKTTGAAATAGVVGTAAVQPEAVAAPSIVVGARELRVAVAWPDAVAGPADDARRLLSRIVEGSEGRLGFQVGEIASGTTGLELVARGDADLYLASDNDHTGLDPAFGYFAGLPGDLGLAPDDLEAWLIAAGGQMLWDDLAGRHGVKPLLAGHTGAPAGLWSTIPIHALDDLADITIAAGGLSGEVVRGLGAEPIALRPGRPSSGPVTAWQGSGLLTDLTLGAPRDARHYYARGLAPAGATITLGLSRPLWDAMALSDRALISGATAFAWRESVAARRAHARVAVAALQQTHGITAAPLPHGIGHQIRCISEAVVAHAAASSPRAQAIDASLMAYLSAVGRNISAPGAV